MLVLSRQLQETIIITTASGERIEIIVVDIRSPKSGCKVRLGINADRGVTIHRGEVQAAIDSAN